MTQEEKAAQLLSEWLDGNTDTPPKGLDTDVVEAIGALRPDLAPAPELDLDGIFDEVMAAQAPAEPIPQPANTTRWWLMGGSGIALAAVALLSVGVALNAGNGPSHSDEAPTAAAPERSDRPMAKAPAQDPPSPVDAVADAGEAEGVEATVDLADATAAPEEPALQIIAGKPATTSASAAPGAKAERGGDGRPQAPNQVVQGVLADRRTAVAVCYNDAAARDALLSGAIEVEWAVSEGRTAYASAVKDSTGDSELQRCLVDLVRELQWPEGADGEWSERWSFTAAGDRPAKMRAGEPMPAMDAPIDDVMLESSE